MTHGMKRMLGSEENSSGEKSSEVVLESSWHLVTISFSHFCVCTSKVFIVIAALASCSNCEPHCSRCVLPPRQSPLFFSINT